MRIQHLSNTAANEAVAEVANERGQVTIDALVPVLATVQLLADMRRLLSE
jgi:G3E family GTPase